MCFSGVVEDVPQVERDNGTLEGEKGMLHGFIKGGASGVGRARGCIFGC